METRDLLFIFIKTNMDNMKCIKCIKVAKGYELNEIRRVKDAEANERVDGGYFKFIPKSEWKAQFKKSVPETEETK